MILDGASKLRGHLANHTFNPIMAKLAASKAALMARLIKNEESDLTMAEIKIKPSTDELRRLEITGEWERLNRLKLVSEDAFWHWYLASKL